MTHKWFTEEKRLRSLRQIILANHFLPLQFSSHKHRRGNHLDQTDKKDLKKKKDCFYLSRRASVVFSQIPKWRKKQWLTVIDSKAKFLYDSQVPADSVQPVYTQTCRGSWEENMNITSVMSCNLLLWFLWTAATPYLTPPVSSWGRKLRPHFLQVDSKKLESFPVTSSHRDPDNSDTQPNPPLFSTWSMHILTKLGTVLLSLWHKSDRLQPNTWSEDTERNKNARVMKRSKVWVLLQRVLWTLRSLRRPGRTTLCLLTFYSR